MKYLRKFNSHSEYLNSNIIPNVSYCEQEDEVHYNYHEYVDLGLPSGTLWAKMNVGAENETDYGLYFAWGETKGYTATPIEDYSPICIIEDNRVFSWSDYKLANNGDRYSITKYNFVDNLTELELVDDGVSINWGNNDWTIPTKELLEELSNTEYVTIDFVNEYQGKQLFGYLITSKINENTLFIPASGKIEGNERTEFGEVSIWSSTRSSFDLTKAWRIHFKKNSVEIKDRGRDDGCVLRGVLKN